MDLSAWVSTADLIAIAVVIVVTLVSRFLLVRLVRTLTKRALERAQQRRKTGGNRAEQLLTAMTFGNQERYEQRTATMGSISSSLISITLSVIGVLTILSILGVPLAPLLTSAGVGGIALAFGAQSLVKDFLSGMFMLMEDQYGVGDIIDTGEVKGTVEEVGLRVTRLRDPSGTVWYVRNGEILRLGNQSQGWSTAIIDVPVAYDEDPGRVITVLEAVSREAEEAEDLADVLLERPTVVGVNAVSATTMTIRLIGKTLPNQHWQVQRWLLEHSLSALAKAGVRSPAPLGILPG
ncbi:mechanosensitive ion channel family protein [Propionicimonas sp.]|uniref:mechanosensitive ion channel family protein n=1 Tax=Propionicimonas sp. TaxID=1955623 RepID=UPI0017BB7D38|nr:mechanosensitive ion channel family protein [Propionicimonas sp.]MBU3976377.1 mechanosensitive ion channel family protein [Actinomycetota bacterium]MBA3022030.1 mechanosensitive ion channel family protein [Propionicimonas sp.]MBU3987534.1 mechanosensitive ion channel family protein [Actinomycetota bacterium]MBU4006521.1 mechanosensitive ion channel family protein [Actinomycetota bacterium]MBU4065126.1 mechanosensitive ion channel family protein [Actinomycetota bacterium]